MKFLKAKPLNGFSSLHEGVLLNVGSLRFGHFSCVISFNIESGCIDSENSNFTMHSHPLNLPSGNRSVELCIDNLRQWILDLKSFQSIDDYLNQMNHKKRNNYFHVEKKFAQYGCTITVHDGDWSEHALSVYKLYLNVASHYMQIYDFNYVKTIATLPTYKLISAWFGSKMIGSLVAIEEGTTSHAMLCGLDYLHSTGSQTYTKLLQEFISFVISSGKYQLADVGITADIPKKELNFTAHPAIIKISAKGKIFKALLMVVNFF